jgi:hypothetical protein
MEKFLKDVKSLELFAKIALVFGPGLLALAYFKYDLFSQLEWLKVVSLAGVFAAVLAGPVFFTIWFLCNYPFWRDKRLLRRLLKRINKSQKATEDDPRRIQQALKDARKQKNKEEIERLKGREEDASSYLKELAAMAAEQETLIKELDAKQKKYQFYSVTFESWHALVILSVEVILFVGVDYFWTHHTSFRDLVSFIFLISFVFFPVMVVANVWLGDIVAHTKQTSRRITFWIGARLLQVIGCAVLTIAGVWLFQPEVSQALRWFFHR